MGKFFFDIVCLLLGALLAFAFAPINAYLLPVLFLGALVPLWCLTTPARAFWRGWLFGCGFFGVGVSWIFVSIHDYGAASPSLAALLTALFIAAMAVYYGVQAWCFRRFFPQVSFTNWCIAFPILWALWEWVRGEAFTGFPWLYLGYSQVDSILSGYIPVIGIYGTTTIVAMISSILWYSIYRKGVKSGHLTLTSKYSVFARPLVNVKCLDLTPFFLIMGGLLIGGYALTFFNWTQPNHDVLQVSLIQGNIPQNEKWDKKFIQSSIKKYTDLTAQHWDSAIIIWPEAALPIPLPSSQSLVNTLDAQAKAHHAMLIMGLLDTVPGEAHYYNAITALGTGKGMYYKQNLVPFGEYVPFENVLRGMIQFFDLPYSTILPGDKLQTLTVQAHAWNIAPLICYEITYAERAEEAARAGNIILTISNDTWFGRSWGPQQHLQMAQFRALETGRMVIRATNNGLTAIIDQKGKITAEIPAFETGVLTSTADTTQGLTPIVRIGHLVIIGLLFVILMICVFCSRRK